MLLKPTLILFILFSCLQSFANDTCLNHYDLTEVSQNMAIESVQNLQPNSDLDELCTIDYASKIRGTQQSYWESLAKELNFATALNARSATVGGFVTLIQKENENFSKLVTFFPKDGSVEISFVPSPSYRQEMTDAANEYIQIMRPKGKRFPLFVAQYGDYTLTDLEDLNSGVASDIGVYNNEDDVNVMEKSLGSSIASQILAVTEALRKAADQHPSMQNELNDFDAYASLLGFDFRVYQNNIAVDKWPSQEYFHFEGSVKKASPFATIVLKSNGDFDFMKVIIKGEKDHPFTLEQLQTIEKAVRQALAQ